LLCTIIIIVVIIIITIMPIIAAPAAAIVRTMANFLAIVLFFLPAWVTAEITVTPSNSIPDQVTTPLLLTGPGISTDTTPSYDIAPLTVNVGMGDTDSVGVWISFTTLYLH
jgi:hypothetical protein